MKTPTTQPLSLPVRLTRSLRTPLWRKTVSSILLAQFALWSVQVKGATYDWDQTGAGALGGTGTWNTSNLNWWNGASIAWPNLNDTARFGGAAGGVVTLGSAISADGLIFNTRGYSIAGAGNALTLTGGVTSNIAVNGIGNRTTIDAQISGTSGLTKTGNGVLVLSNNSNNFTGNVLVNQGALVVTNPSQLGSGSLVSVNGANQVNNTGGMLVLQGGLAGMTFSKNLSLAGRGLNYANSTYASLANIGQNTISGNIAFGNASSSGIGNAYGNLTLSGTIGLATGQSSIFGLGNGNTVITGQVTGSAVSNDRFVKAQNNLGTTVWLTNTANNYVSDTRIDSGTLRVSTNAVLGASTSATALDFNGGTLEVLTDSPDFSTRNVRIRDNGAGTIFVSRGLAGSGLNQTVTFGTLTGMNINTTLTVNGRDGYNVNFGGGSNIGAGGNGTVTINSSGNGTVVLNTPSLWNNTDTTGSRTLTIGGNSETTLTGIINAAPGSANHNLTKSGQGNFIIQGTTSNLRGNANVTGGTLSISSFGAINNNATPGSGALQLNAGALSFTGAAGTGAGETVSKAVNLNGTTGLGAILANQSGTSPSALIISNSIAATGAGIKTLFLGGSASSGIINQVQGVIQNNSGANTTGVTKVGPATWLYSPSVASYGTAPAGVTVTAGGAAQTNSFTVSSSTGLAVGQVVAGTNVPTGAIITNINGNVITINANIGTAVAAATALTFTQNSNFTGAVTVGGGALQVVPTATTGVGSNLFANTQALTFNIDNLTNNASAGGTFQLGTPSPALTAALTQTMGALTLTAGAGRVQVDTGGASFANTLNFASIGTRAAGATVNFAPAATNAGIQFAANPTGLNGQLGGYATITNSSGAVDFVATPTVINTNITALGATTVLPATGATGATNYVVNTAVSTTAASAANTVRIIGGNNLTLGGALTITSTSATAIGGILHDNAGGASTISGTNLFVSAANGELIVNSSGTTPANTLTISSVITGNNSATAGSGGLTKSGSGVLVLSGANTYTGTTTVNEGTVRLSGSGTLGGTNAGLLLRQGATLDLNGVNVGTSITTGGLNAFSGAGTITNSAASGTAFIRVGNNNGGGTFSGLIQDGATAKTQFVKAGTGTVSLTGTNTFTGGLVLSGGTLAVNALPNFGTNSPIGPGISGNNAGSIVFNGGGTLQYTGSNTSIYQTTQTPSIITDRLFTIDGTGASTATIDSSGQYGNNTTGAGAANNAALVFGNTSPIVFAGTGARTIQLTGNSSGDNEFKPLIQDKTTATELTGVTKAGTGLWHLTGTNTYSGPTTITAGALQAVDGVGLPATSNLAINGGVFQTTGTFSRAVGTAAGQVQWTAGGGFSAGASKLTVNLGGAGASFAFGAAAPVNASTLILSSATAQSDVDFTNPINLGTAARTIQVDDNSQSNFDFATVSAVISGGAGGALTKSGGGTLILGASNTYVGATTISGGNLFVQSIGSSGATATSLGTNVSGGALNIGSTTNAGAVFYFGSGETTTRLVNIAGTTGGATIDSSGSGPLNLTNLAISGAGAKTLTIRGFNTDANSITNNLADNGGALGVTKADPGVWELSGNNTFTGNLNIGGGMLGVTSVASLGSSLTGNIDFQNGALYSLGGALSIARTVRFIGNSNATFTGTSAFTLTGTTITGTANGGNWTLNNTITSPAGLTISSNFASAEAATQARSLVIQGTGNTVLSGVLQSTAAANGGVALVVNTAPTATTTLTGSSPNLQSANSELRSGILILDKAQALGLSATAFDLNGGELRTSSTVAAQTQANVFRLNGSVGLVNGSNPLNMTGSIGAVGGNRTLQNDIVAGTGLTISALNLSQDTNARTLTLTGVGTTNITGVINNTNPASATASSFTYSGSGVLNISGAAANAWTGTAIFNGGTTTVSNGATLGSTGAATVNQATLTLSNTATQTNNRLGGRALTLSGATLNVLGNASAGGTEGGTPSTLTIGSGGSTINATNLFGTNTLGFTTLTVNTGGSINFTGGVGTATNQVTFSTPPTLSPVTTGILARATVNGADFATYGANGIAAFTGYTNPADLNSAAATDTVRLNGTTTVGALTTNKTVNALAFNASAPTVSNSAGTVLTLTSGGILTTGTGPYTLSARTNLGAEGALHVGTGSTLNISGVLSGAAGLNKNLTGALNLNAANFITGTTTLNGGTTTLAGGLNTIFPAQTLVVNPGATLDLNGNSQYVQAFGGGNNPGTGGTITSSSAALFTNNGNVAYGGAISGAITMNKTGGSTLIAESPLSYTGATWITGGTLTLRDNATLLNTSAININYGTLNLDSNANLQIANDNRVSDTAAIALRGGTLTYSARFAAQGTETLGAVTLAAGASTLNINANNNASNNAPFLSTDVTFASLTRNAGTTVNITANQGFGNNGNANRVFFTAAPTTLANGMMGGWAIANTTDFAGYDPVLGFGAIGYGGFKGYDLTFAPGNITQFINNALPTSNNLSAATTTTSALRLGGLSQNDITFSSGSNVLVLESGGLLRSNQAAGSNIGTTASRGVLTAGTGSAAELVIYSAATGTITSAATATTTINSNVITTVPSTVGLAPGQTITNANFPAGTYIVSIDSPTQITVSQNATANGSANQAIVTGRDNVVVNSVIADNGAGVVSLVKSGAGVLNLSANNTYTGGSIFNQGTVNLIGSGTVIPAGGVTLNGATLALNTNAGQIDASNVITLNDSSTLTLVGNNSLNSLVFNNTGGTGNPTVATGTGTLSLTAATPVTVVSNNVSTVPTISGFVNLGSSAKTFNIGDIQIGSQVISTINPALNVSAVMNGAASLTKTGNGILQLSGQNVFTGGVNLTQGGILIGASSSPSTGGQGITGGPLGSGPLAASAGTRLLVDNSRSIANDISFAGTPTFDSTANTAWTLTLNGSLTGAGLASPTPSVQVSNPFLTVALLGKIPNIGTITSFNKTGPGVLVFNSTGYTGDFNAAALGNAAQVQLLNDGDGTGSIQTIGLGNVVFDSGIVPNIIVGRAGGSLPLPTAANKILSPASISNLGSGITVTNNNGYGLAASDSATLALFGGAAPVISVATASASDVTQGLYLNGALSGIGFTKTGAGTVVLGSASNTFAGSININQGIVSVGSNAQLGNAANIVQLNPQTGTASLRATGTFTLANPLQLSNTANARAIEVTSGNTLTLASAFDLNAGAGATASLLKADRGTLALTAANSGWSGTLTINGGVVSTSLPAALGTGTIVVNETGAALQVSGGITVANPITIDVTANGRNNTGISTGGALQSVSGSNTFSGAITVNASPNADNQTRNFGFGADSGATLNLGAINLNHPSGGANRNVIGFFNTPGTGVINVTGVIDNTNGSVAANTFLFKIGDGTMTLSAANAIPDTEVRVYRGNLTLNSAATFGTSAGAAAAQVQALQNGSITFDNSVTNTANRLTNRVVQIGGGTLNFIPNSAGSSQVSTGALQISPGANVINLAAGGNQTVTFASLTQNGGATLNMIGSFGTANNKLIFTTAPALSPAAGGLLARFTTNGNEFATYNGTTGITTFAGYAPATNVLSAGATQTYRATSATANSLTGAQTLNALTLQSGPLFGNVPNVGGLLGLNPTTLTLTSGAILANGTGAGTNSTLSVPVVALGGTEGIVHVASGQTLNVSSGFSGTNGFTKSLNGTLNLNQQQFVSGNTIVNGGTLNLQSGATNTLLFNNGLVINSGATVDMKNGVQFIAGLSSANAGGNTDLGGGTLTNSGAQATLVTNSNNSFNGQITGTIYLNKTGVNSLNLQSANTYTGNTFISGGTLFLQDDASILNSPDITINYGTLTLANGGLRDNSNRVSDTAPITMTGGTINFSGRAQAASSETLGAVTLLAGNNSIFADDGNVGVGTGTLTLASVARAAGSIATLRFNNVGDLGLLGSRGRILITSAPTLTNNILGPWAIIDREYASYDATYGIGALNQTGFAGYSGSGLNTSPLATDNVRFTTTGTTTLLANTTVGTLTFGQQAAATVLNLGGNTLTLQGGGLLLGQGTDNVDFSITNGNLTSGVLNSPSDFYLTQANYGGTNRTVTIGAAITNNGTGAVRLIKSGGQNDGITTLSGLNTYTGGTVVNSGTLTLGATGTLGTGGITVNQATLTQTAGGIIPSQALTMNGGSVVTFTGNNTLSGLTIDNNGGSAPTLTPTGILTLTGGTTVTTSNAGAVATLSTGTIDLNGASAYSVNVGATLVNGQNVAPWQAGLIINSTIQNGGITKTGAGVLQLGGANTFTGGVTISTGGLIIASDTNSLLLNDPVVTGPVGTGPLTMGANTTLVAGGAARTITNDVTFLGDAVFNGTNNLTLNGTTTLPSVWGATITAPQMTVTIGNATPSLSSDVINKSGLGLLVVGNYAGTINASGGLLFASDGNALGTAQSINLTGDVTIAGDTAITVNRSGGAPNARNKILQKVDLVNGGSIMSVSNLSGYGLEFTGTTTLNGASHFAVGTATASNVVQGLILSGVVSDAGGYDLVKSGPGTLVLGNSGNTFGGAGKTIDILGGILSVGSDGALGNSSNTIKLNADASAGVGFRSTGTFSTSRTFNLNQANNAFEVTAGNTLTLTTPFTLSAATNTLSKNDNGILEITANNTGWTGGVTINSGAILIGNANAIGSGVLTINNAAGSALQLTGGTNYASPITLSVSASGFDNRGVIESVSGVNTISGAITQTSGFAIVLGASGTSTLNISGGISASNSTTFNAGAGATINLSSIISPGGPGTNKLGAGTMNVTANQTGLTGALNINQGTLNVSGSGVTLGITGLISVNASGTLTIDDAAATAARLGNRALTIQGGTFNYLGSTSTETSTGALTFSRMGGIYNQTASTSAAVTFGSLGLGADATANFTGAGLGTAANRLLFTTAPTLTPATTGILARATVNGADFATIGANGLAAFTAYQNSNNPNTAATTDTMNLTANAALTANRTLNSVKISGGTAVTLGGAAFNQLALTAGGVLATGAATHVISVPVLANAAVQGIFHVNSGSALNVTSTLTGTAGLVKDGSGTLTIGSPASISGIANVNANTLSGNLTVARGTLTLNGGTNTYAPGQFLVMGGPASTLNLNGTSQQFSGLMTDTATPGSGGSIIGGAGSQLVMNQDNTARTFAGSIGGSVNFVRSGQNTLTLVSPNSYTGTTLINGNTTVLQSDGILSGTSAIDINYATLTLDNTGLSDSANRINDAATLGLRGGTLNFNGRAQAASTETLGAVSAIQGFSSIASTAGATGVNSTDLLLTSLSRPAGSTATLNVTGTNLGTIGSNSRVTVTTLNGVTTTNPVYSANGSGLTNNLVGGWAISNNDFLTYIPGLGLAPLNQTGAAQYDLTNSFIGAASTDNVRLTAATAIPNGGVTINALSLSGSNIAQNFTTGTDTLNIVTGGLIGTNNNTSIGATLDSGRITAGGLTPASNSDLYVYNRGNTLTINSRIIDNVNGGGSAVRAVFTASGGAITLVNPSNSYTGGTVLNGGTLNLTNTAATAVIPAGGLTINGGTVTMNNFAGQINAANVVTLNGAGSTLNLWGDNTLAGLVFNNNGGGSGNNAVNTFSQAATAGAAANGVLTVGASGIVATSSNIASNSFIIGRTDFGATNKTVQVDSASANGVDINPLFAGLNIQGIVGSTGGFTKTGTGVLALQAQAHYTGPTTVTNGTLRVSVANAGSRLSALTLGAGTYLNLANASTTWGSLAGSGTIFASAGTPTLTVGFNNDATTTFSGQLVRFNDAVINGVSLQKVGTGELVMTSAQSFATGTTGTITVNGGSLRYLDAGAAFPGTATSGQATFSVNNGGTLALDNTGTTSVNNRLGLNVIGTLNLQGGRLAINAGSTAATPVTELVTTFNVTNGGGRIELTPGASNPVTLTVGTLNVANGNGTLVVGGIDGSVAGTAGKAALVITTPNLLGGQGGGLNGSTTMSVRHDILGDASVSGLGTGFLVRDTAVGGTYRALSSSELASAFALPLTTDVDPVTTGTQAAGALNVGLTGSAATIGVNTVANTLTISGTSSISSSLGAAFGAYGPGGNLITTSLSNAAASLTLAGATGTINTAFGSTTAGTTPFAHVIAGGTLNVNGAFGFSNVGTTGTAGLAKAGGGTMNLNNKAYYTGTTSVNNGTLNLNSGSANTLAVVPTTGGATVSQLNLNGTSATVDLKGQNQAFGTLTSVNPLPGQGGTLTNTGAAATLSISTQAASGTFGGSITGAIALTRSGANTTTLTNANTYTGATIVRGGTLQLRDSGTISSTAGLTLNYGTLNWDNFGLNAAGTPNPTRIAATNPVTLQGGTFTINGAGSTDTVLTLNSVTVTGGNNVINVLPYINEGSTVKLTIGNLVRNVNNRSGVVFNGFSLNNSTGASTLGGQGLTQNGNIILNQINGTNFTASNLVNNLIGGWAVADGSTFATYVNGFGVSVMGQTTQGIVAPGFTGTDVSAALVATGNYNDGSNRTLAAGAVTANSLRFGPGANQTITFPATTTLSLGTGIITNAGFSTTLAATDASNTLAGTGTDLYFYINQNTVAVQPAIVGTAALVSNGPATLSLRPTFASNTYSGGTFVNAGTLNLQAGGAFTVIPGDLTINNAAVTMSVQVNQIAATSNVFINGGGSLTFPNYATGPTQTLASLTFTNDGGTGNPSLTLGTPTVATSTLILSSATPITSTNNSLATTPTISTGAATLTALQFSNANPVITVNDGLAETELTISAPITQNASMTSLSKTGTGVLALSGQSTFTTGFNLNQGGLMFGAGSTGSPTITSGPVGTGTLTIAGSTSLLSDGTVRTILNPTTVNGNFAFTGPLAGGGVILSGAMNLGATGRTITVDSPANTSTISGAITSTATGTALTKAGAGILVLSNATSSLAGAGVAVTGGILRNGITNAVPAASPITISAGAGYDLNGFSQTSDTLTGPGFLTNSANSAQTLTLGGASVSSTLDTTLTDNILAQSASRLALTKVGTGTLTIPTANNHSGVTTVSGGMISITNALSLGTVTGGTVVASGASLELSNNITVTGEALSIAGTGSATNGALRNLSGNNTFAGLVTLTGAASIQSDAGTLTLDVPTGNAIAATNQNLTFTGAGNTTVADPIATGTGTLTKAGSGSLTLGANNTYSGKTTIADGTISVGSLNALGTNAALDLGVATASSGRLLYTGAAAALSKNINALGNGTDTIQNAGSGLLTLSGTLTKAGTTLSLVGGASGILVTGTIVGLPASSDLVIGNGITTLQNANSYNGPTILNSGGTLNINHASAISTGALTINGGTIDNTSGADITLTTNNPLNINANFTFTGTNNLNLGTGAVTLDANRTVTVTANTLTIGGAIGGAFSLTGTGAGTLLLTGASTYTGTTTAVTGSTISVGGNGSLGDTSAGTVIDSGASLALNNVLYTDAEPLNLNGTGVGNGGAFRTTGVSSFAGTITASTNATINATGTLSLTGGLVKNGTTLTLGGTGTYNISGAGISGASANSDLVVDSSTVNLDVASNYNGPTFIRNGGRINANVTDALPTSISRTAIIMDDSGTGSSTLALAVNQRVASLTGAATSQILLGASELTVGASGSGSSIFAGSIAGIGGSIVKDGTNTQTFSGANTYTGTTTLNAGTLNLGSAENAGVSGPLGNGGSIVFGGGTLQYSASNQNDYSSRFSTAAGQAIRIDTNGQNVTLATALTSSGGSLNKQGAGTLTVTAANTFDAGTTVNGGTLLVNNTTGSGTGSGAVSVSNAGTVLGGNGTVGGNLTVNAGALIAPGSAANTAGTLTIGGSTVVIAGNGVAETRLNFDYSNATGNVPGLTSATWSSYNGALLTGNGGQNNDLLNFTASTTSLSWGTGGKISLNQIGSAYSWVQGDVFNLLDWTALGDSGNGPGSIGGSFNSAIDFNLPSLSGGLAWDTSRFVTTGAIAVVPEPSRALLMLFGLMALFFRRRRQD